MKSRSAARQNDPRYVTGEFRAVRTESGASTDTSLRPNQVNTFRIPRALEQLGAPVHMTEHSRAYLITLPIAGIRQVAHEISVAIDSGIPVTSVVFDVDLDREEGWDELVAKLNVRLPADKALLTWEDMEVGLHKARQNLDPDAKTKMEEGFALYVEWEPTHQ